MKKIIRLSMANIKKHKKESILLGILIMLCTILFASSIASLIGIRKITPKMAEETGSYRNFVLFDQDIYSDKYLIFLDDESKVKSYAHTNYVNGNIEIKNYQGSGKDSVYDIGFVTEGGERQFEKFEPETSLSDDDIRSMEHPIYLTKKCKDDLLVSEGDEVTFIFDKKKEYTFTVAGFFEQGLWLPGPKAVISDKDFETLEDRFDRFEIIGFDEAEGADSTEFIKEFKAFIKDVSINDTSSKITSYSYQELEDLYNINSSLLSVIIAVMAGVIVIAVMVMIRFRIVTDISEQIVSIGVLEAIGYKSGEIALSYIFEYILIAIAGCILAIAPSVFMAEFQLKNAASAMNYSGKVDIPYIPIVIVVIVMLLFVGLIAMTKALSVNKYPPVMAFRKGIAAHHFKKTFLPLEKTKGNVHIRLAFKEFLQNFKSNIGLTVCITITTIMVLISFTIGSFFNDEENILKSVSGHELPDIDIVVSGETNPESFANELRSMPEVDRVLTTASSGSVKVNDNEYAYSVEVYKDFSETETIVLTQGRYPKHDNEIAVTSQADAAIHVKMGDTVTLEYGKVKRDYVVCGVVNCMVNSNTVYMTEDGYKKLNPVYKPDSYKIFLKDDTDIDAFSKILIDRYGNDLSEIAAGEVTGESYEDRIRSAAEIKMAKAMTEQGVSYMEYSIRIGDEVISGSTSNMKIKSMEYTYDYYKDIIGQVTQVFGIVSIGLMVMSAIVVMIILSILMASTIRKQYRELGIMKGLGYTSRELKFQMAFRMIPPTVIAVVLGTIINFLILKLLVGLLAKISVSIVSIVIVDIIILLFCFVCAYINAKKIGKISVYELMTE